jgi:hypothetical protein
MKCLKEERRQGISTGNLDQTNERKHKEGMFSSGYGKEWGKTNKISRKKIKFTQEDVI